MTIENTSAVRLKLQEALEGLIKKIDKVQIGTKDQFPFGWRTAGKGRSVWRILEELITQNLQAHGHGFGMTRLTMPVGEVSVYDFEIHLNGFENSIFVNVKSALDGAFTSKDDISKGKGLLKFYEATPSHELFIATINLKFNDDMSVSLVGVTVMPTAWLPDLYVNPSNNGNLQSSKYKDVAHATKRTNVEFVAELQKAVDKADQKKIDKAKNVAVKKVTIVLK